MWKKFKEFAFKGNVIDMAIGVVIGSAFSKIVTSLVNDIITPVISLITKGTDFSALGIALGEGEDAAVFAYGSFIQNIIDFFIIAFSMFMVMSLIGKLKDAFAKKQEEIKEAEEAADPTPTELEILTEIRDYLKESKKD